MRLRNRLATVALVAGSISSMMLSTAPAANAAVLCGTLPAHYAGSTYRITGEVGPDNLTFNGDGTIFREDQEVGTFTVNLQSLTLDLPVRWSGPLVSTFRGCDASLTKPGFVALRTSRGTAASLTRLS